MMIDFSPYLYTKGADSKLDAELSASTKFGKVRLGQTTLFWRYAFKRYAIALDSVYRIHRRLNPVVGRLCAGGRNYDIEYLVLILHDGSELVVHIGDDIKKTAEALFAALQQSHPEIHYGKE